MVNKGCGASLEENVCSGKCGFPFKPAGGWPLEAEKQVSSGIWCWLLTWHFWRLLYHLAPQTDVCLICILFTVEWAWGQGTPWNLFSLHNDVVCLECARWTGEYTNDLCLLEKHPTSCVALCHTSSRAGEKEMNDQRRDCFLNYIYPICHLPYILQWSSLTGIHHFIWAP